MDSLPVDPARIVVRERLNCLAICYYVRGGVMVFFGCFFMLYVCMFTAISFIPESAWNQPSTSPSVSASPSTGPGQRPANPGAPPAIVFRIMAGVMGLFVLAGVSIGVLTLYAGRCLQRRRKKGLIYTMAALNCPFVPYGITLGVFTFIVMTSVAAKEEFEQAA